MEFSIWGIIRAFLLAALLGFAGMGCVAHSSMGVGEAKTQCQGESKLPTLTQPQGLP